MPLVGRNRKEKHKDWRNDDLSKKNPGGKKGKAGEDSIRTNAEKRGFVFDEIAKSRD